MQESINGGWHTSRMPLVLDSPFKTLSITIHKSGKFRARLSGIRGSTSTLPACAIFVFFFLSLLRKSTPIPASSGVELISIFVAYLST